MYKHFTDFVYCCNLSIYKSNHWIVVSYTIWTERIAIQHFIYLLLLLLRCYYCVLSHSDLFVDSLSFPYYSLSRLFIMSIIYYWFSYWLYWHTNHSLLTLSACADRFTTMIVSSFLILLFISLQLATSSREHFKRGDTLFILLCRKERTKKLFSHFPHFFLFY